MQAVSPSRRSGRCWGRLAQVGFRPREAPPGHDFAANVLHVDEDTICPRCLTWVCAEDIVRRTRYGLVQHEACPVAVTPLDTAGIS
jgi:hypothetical protein